MNRAGLKQYLKRIRKNTAEGRFNVNRSVDGANDALNKKLFKALDDLPPGAKVLELGVGNAVAYCALQTRYPHLRFYGINYSTHNPTSLHGKGIASAEASKLPYNQEWFNFVYGVHFFQYVPDKLRCLEEVHRVLKKDGIALIHREKTPGIYEINGENQKKQQGLKTTTPVVSKQITLTHKPEITVDTSHDLSSREIITIKKRKPRLTFEMKLHLPACHGDAGGFYSVYKKRGKGK
ncbi:MAG: methyltransferase domain-containing protein [Candidatus Micrarchaeota archaeon]